MSEKREKDKRKMLKPGVAIELGGDYPTSEDAKGIDQTLLERRLEGLRDTQESVQGLSLWCQANKRHAAAIIETWLNILRKSPVEKRLTLFYLSNDIVQHARRKNDLPVINQWAFAVQKATPFVRTPSSVSTAIARIFKIWEERNVYSKETVADLLALLNNVPAKERIGEKKKPETYTASSEKVAAFQSSTLISKVKLAYRLKSHLGVTFRAKPFVHIDMESLKASIKDRSHGMEVIQEIGQLVEQLKASEAKLQAEVEERRKIVETAEIAIVNYENVRGEAKIVNSAYKDFTERVQSTKEKVDEKMKSFEEMEIDVSPVPSPPPSAPSPPPDEDDFGIRPADSMGTSEWQNISQPTTSNNIRSDIMDAIKSAIPATTASDSQASSSNSVMGFNSPSYGANSINAGQHSQYDPTMGGSMPSLAAMQQQFQQTWGNNQAGNFAAMSAMIQQMLPGNNYLPMQQQGGYGTAIGYETYQPQNISHAQSTIPDVSSIPLPPPSEPPLPPPPVPQDTTNNSHMQMPDMNSQSTNPYQNPYSYESVDSNEYIPTPYYKSQHESMNYSTEYEPYVPSTSTPTGNKSSRYQPYQDRRVSETSSGGGKPPSLLSSPGYSNHAGSGNSANDSRYYTPNNNSTTTPNSEKPTSLMSFDPMEMFASALSKNKNNSQARPPSSLEMSLNRSISSDSSPSPNQSFNQIESFYGGTSMYDSFDDTGSGAGTNGDDADHYSPMGNYAVHLPGMGFQNKIRGRGMSPGTPRGTFQNNRPPRGHRGGVGRGGSPNPRGFGGFRGRGSPRGPPRGGRSRFQV